jgi:hypothetical protein
MVRSPAIGPRALLIGVLLVVAGPVRAASDSAWDVTVAFRLSGSSGAAISLRVALPPTDEAQTLGEVEVTARGLTATVTRDGDEPHVLLRGKLKGARRVAVRYRVQRQRLGGTLPAISPLETPPPALLPYLTPSPIFQSRSILVRDFLETRVGPMLDAPGAQDLVRTLHQVTRERFEWATDGKTLTLDVLRSGRGKRIGIERLFTTFLRCAHVPARFVEGLNLASTTRHKRVFWTEVWGQNRWWPVSASSGWMGRLPKAYIELTRDGQRAIQIKGATASYTVQARPVAAKELAE